MYDTSMITRAPAASARHGGVRVFDVQVERSGHRGEGRRRFAHHDCRCAKANLGVGDALASHVPQDFLAAQTQDEKPDEAHRIIHEQVWRDGVEAGRYVHAVDDGHPRRV